MFHFLGTALFTGAAFASIAAAQTVPVNPQLVGTWSTKSHQVFTGPVRTILPARPHHPLELRSQIDSNGRSQCVGADAPAAGFLRSSQREDVRALTHRLLIFFYRRWLLRRGLLPSHLESYVVCCLEVSAEARLTALATSPQCPEGLMQWQHGTYAQAPDGSLQLTPFGVDGRQLLSKPCSYGSAVYTRYNQSEHFKVGIPPSSCPPIDQES